MNATADALAVVEQWTKAEWLRPLDAAFVRFLADECPDAPPALLIAAALASHQLGRGHVCLDIAATLADPSAALSLPPPDRMRAETPEPSALPPEPADVLAGLTADNWIEALQHPALIAPGAGSTPLVLEQGRLYLRRYWQFECDVAAAINARLEPLPSPLPPAQLQSLFAALFPPTDTADEVNWQKIACGIALRQRFAVMTGGPGTGKTTTVLALLALLQATALASGHAPLRIHLAAPTGKAAARLNESIALRMEALPLAELGDAERIRRAIPEQVTTLHRLLGAGGNRRRRHNARHPLPVDVLVIDEASMVDLEMMAAVIDALPADARLILLGDRDQLASVEAGAVLGELCTRAGAGHYGPRTAEWLQQATGERLPDQMIDEAGRRPDQAIAMLRKSHRFAADSAIGELARAINAGERPAWMAAESAPPAGITLLQPDAPTTAAWRDHVLAGCADTLQKARSGPDETATAAQQDAWAVEVLQARQQFQVLAALRNGPWGVAGLNAQIEQWLMEAGWIEADDPWYVGRPVMMTRNDYALGLMNGDLGITLDVVEEGVRRRRVAFADNELAGGVRWVSPLRLAHAETVHAMTVHKSQGSEFTEAALVLPPGRNPLVTRELLYTGVTRARDQVTLVLPGGFRSFASALTRRVRRASGLNARLWPE